MDRGGTGTAEADPRRAGAPPETPGGGYARPGPAVWIFGTAMLLIGIATTILMLQDFRSESYLYLAFYSIPANTAITVFPHEPVLIYFGQFADLWLTAGAATAGTLAAGYMDYAVFVPVLNLEGRQGYKRKKLYRTAASWYMRFPFATLVVAGFSPVPFFPFKFMSFSVHYPLPKYLLALAVARYPRYLLLAWAGLAFEIPNWILFGAFLFIIALYLVRAGPEILRRLRRG